MFKANITPITSCYSTIVSMLLFNLSHGFSTKWLCISYITMCIDTNLINTVCIVTNTPCEETMTKLQSHIDIDNQLTLKCTAR